MSLHIDYHIATLADLPALQRAGTDVFDHPVKPDRAREFLADPRHHLMLARHGDRVVGIASGFHYLHPDKDPILFVNEVAVQKNYQNQGIARTLVRQLCDHGHSIGCTEAWIATMDSNTPARRAFTAAGGTEVTEPVVLIEYPFKK